MKKYYKDYKLVTKIHMNGKAKQEVQYSGKYYISQLNKAELLKVKVRYFALALCSDIALIGVGLINTPGSRILYIALPYVGLFFPAFYCLMGAIKFSSAGDKLVYAAFDKSINRIYRSCLGQIILSSITIIGEICYLLFNKHKDRLLGELLFLSGMVIVLALNVLLFRNRNTVIYKVDEPVNQS